MMDLNKLVEKAKELGAKTSAIVNISDIQFSEEFRKLCKNNACGNYNTNWMCPPAIEPLEVLKAKVLKLSEGVVIQTVYKLEDSFDYDGMIKAGKIHDKIFRNVLEYIKSTKTYPDVLALNVGSCKICKKCAYLNGKECRFPDKAIPSIEAYGIDVNVLLAQCGIPYNNGSNTVSLVGLFLF